jgi:hypothetical protein
MGAAFMSHREGYGRIETSIQQDAGAVNERLAGAGDDELTRAFQPRGESASLLRVRFRAYDQANIGRDRLIHGASPLERGWRAVGCVRLMLLVGHLSLSTMVNISGSEMAPWQRAEVL